MSDAEWDRIVDTVMEAAQEWSAWGHVFLIEIGVQP